MPTLVTGAQGPFTNQLGGYGRNAAFNYKKASAPKTPSLMDLFSGKRNAPTGPVSVQYTAQANGGITHTYDAFGYAEQHIEALDANKNKTLDVEEFTAPMVGQIMNQLKNPLFNILLKGQLNNESLAMARQLYQQMFTPLFTMVDRDGNGELDTVEVAAYEVLLTDDFAAQTLKTVDAKIAANPDDPDAAALGQLRQTLGAAQTQPGNGILSAQKRALRDQFLMGAMMPGNDPNQMVGKMLQKLLPQLLSQLGISGGGNMGGLGDLFGDLFGGPEDKAPPTLDPDAGKPQEQPKAPAAEEKIELTDDMLDDLNLDLNLDELGDMSNIDELIADATSQKKGTNDAADFMSNLNLPGMQDIASMLDNPAAAASKALIADALDGIIADGGLRQAYVDFKA